ncbi:MAG: SDR family oxidoreductase [Lentisphaeria bacterium]|nr:SDR family oxidoreductase [Lentisphaeria bacterium]
MISSICAIREGGWNFGYGVMKGGIVAMTRCMANIVARYHINVNAIAPGIIRTDLTENQGCFEEKQYQNFVGKYPAGRLGEVDDIAGAALFLASDMSSFVNGQQIVVDGGFSGN